jgi:hypothetical protein
MPRRSRWTRRTIPSRCENVDGIMTNHVGDLLAVLQESPYCDAFRLARRRERSLDG